MKPKLLTPLLLAAALLGACTDEASVPLAGSGLRHRGRIALEPCAAGGDAALSSVEALCGTLEVPEDRGAPGGRKLPLNIAILPAESERASDPVFFLAGGPGQAATELAPFIGYALRAVRKRRDIVLIDQRGTGKSNPLECLDARGKRLEPPDSAAPGREALIEYARSCAASVQGRADPRFYTTGEAVRDLDAVRDALGAARINLVGSSYGTRVAQQYARHYPQQVRSLVLDGVVPNDLVIGGEFAHTFEDALSLQSQQCDKLPACRKRFGSDFRRQLRALMAKLDRAPVEVEYRDPATGEGRRGTVTVETATGLAFAFSYAPQTAALLPLTLDEARQGRYAPLMALGEMMRRQLDSMITRGMHWSVLCAEDAPRYVEGETEDTVLGPEVARLFFAPCTAWPHGSVENGFTAALETGLPVLLLSGELDPVTPPAYAESMLSGLPNGRHLVLRGQGHGTLALGCMPKLLARFVETADARGLDADCLDSMSYVPPFTSFNGWEP